MRVDLDDPATRQLVAALMGDHASQRALGRAEAGPNLAALRDTLPARLFVEVKARALIAMARRRLAVWHAENDPVISRRGDVRITTHDGWASCEWLTDDGGVAGVISTGTEKPLTLEHLPGSNVPSKVLWAAQKCVLCPCPLHAAVCTCLDSFASSWRSAWGALTAACLAAAELVPTEEQVFERWPYAALTLDGTTPPADEVAQASREVTIWALGLGDPLAEDVERLERG